MGQTRQARSTSRDTIGNEPRKKQRERAMISDVSRQRRVEELRRIVISITVEEHSEE